MSFRSAARLKAPETGEKVWEKFYLSMAAAPSPSLTILVIGDPHFKDNNVSETNTLRQDCLRYCEVWKPDLIVCLGDLLDRFEKGHLLTHKRAVRFLLDLSEKAPTFLLIGNHDRPVSKVYQADDHFFTGVARSGVLEIVDRPLVREIGGLRLGFTPYVPNGTLATALQEAQVDPKQLDAMFAHQEILGADIRPTESFGQSLSKNGDHWSADYCPLISGHIHLRQTLGNVYYPGSPYQIIKGEDTNKGLCRLLLRKGAAPELSYGPTSIPLRLLLELTVQEFLQYRPQEGARVKITVHCDAAESEMLQKTPQYKALFKDVKLVRTDTGPKPATVPIGTTPAAKYWDVVKTRLNERQQTLLGQVASLGRTTVG